MNKYKAIGKPTPRIDGAKIVSGVAEYTADLRLPNMLIGKIVRSPLRHARILNVDTSRAEALLGVKAVVTAKDTLRIPYDFLPKDAPIQREKYPLAVDKVCHVGDEVAAVAAVDQDTALEALDLIRVDYEELPAVFDPEEAMQPGAPRIHAVEHNIAVYIEKEYGSVQEGFRRSDVIVEGRFATQAVAHCTMEPHCCLVKPEPGDYYTIWNSTQNPNWNRIELANVLGIPLSNIRVMPAYVGGGFGGKSKIGFIEAPCCLLARKSRRPVKIMLTSEEEFTVAGHRLPFVIYMRTGARNDGTLMAREARVIADSGAYSFVSPTIVGNSLGKFFSLFRCPNIKMDARLVYTNKSPSLPFRGFGTAQIGVAMDSQMDELAERLGMDPVELVLKNANQAGEVTPGGYRLTSCGFRECVTRAAEAIGWKKNAGKGSGRFKRGIGFGTSMLVSGAKVYWDVDCAGAIIKIDDDGGVVLITSAIEIGTGSSTILAQIAAEELGVGVGNIRTIIGDSAVAPWDIPGASADRTTLIAGNAVRKAAHRVRTLLLEVASEMLQVKAEDLTLEDGKIFVRSEPANSLTIAEVGRRTILNRAGDGVLASYIYNSPAERFDFARGVGDISAGYNFACHAVEVEVDSQTGRVRVLKVAAAHDLGRTINPLLAEGQIRGGFAQGMGMALYEELCFKNGEVMNPNYMDYKLPLSEDAPQAVLPIFVETNEEKGPFGAKGLGESPTVASVAAIINAIHHAAGVRIRELPATPEKTYKALKATAA